MISAKETVINLVEAAYNLELGVGDWLQNVVATAKPILDPELGCYATLTEGVSKDGQHLITQVHIDGGPQDLALRYFQAAQAVGADGVARWSEALGARGVTAISEPRDDWPHVVDAITEHVGCKDGLSISAIDPDGHGAYLSASSPEIIELTPGERECWQMLAVHLSAGYRLRRGLTESTANPGVPATEMPLNAEALLDPAKFVVSHAAGGAQDGEASKTIREAAVRVDKARGELRKSDPEEALELWHGLSPARREDARSARKTRRSSLTIMYGG